MKVVTELTYALFEDLMKSFSPWEDGGHIALAISGGSDSMALALLASQWCAERNLSLTGIIVDHQLRPESTKEAIQTQDWLKDRGISNEILTWVGEKPKKSIQEIARNARYKLIEDWCRQNGANHLLTAHHADDQWETMMQRLIRKSGPKGLRGILPERQFQGGRILRPFLVRRGESLGISKLQILNYLKNENQPYVQDPSNDNGKYERVRWRQEREMWESKGYSSDYILQEIRKASAIYDELSTFCQAWWNDHVEISDSGYLTIDKSSWEACCLNQKEFILQRILTFFKERIYPIPASTLQKVLSRLEKEQAVGACGCFFLNRKESILVAPEVRGLPRLFFKEISSNTVWWGRWQITLKDARYKGWVLESFGKVRANKWCAQHKEAIASYLLSPMPCLVNQNNQDEFYVLPLENLPGVEVSFKKIDRC